MNPRVFKLKSRVWIYPGPSSWYFVTLPKQYAPDILKFSPPIRRGFGAIKVKVIIGKTTWLTSIFPDKETQSYILPLKREVRRKEKILADQLIKYSLEIV